QQPMTRAETVPAADRPAPVADMKPERVEAAASAYDPAAAAGVRAISAADPAFDVNRFLDGARSAYAMILEAFWKGDREELAFLTGGDVRESFEAAITEREASGLKLDNRLVAIERAVIESAEVQARTAYVTVRFDADIAAVTRDAEGNVVAGSLSDAIETHDVWTFRRDLSSADPNWLLVETDEVA
ncbi:MAG TPA: Tim44/TimA family putative adaptor protein, partial [Allosphingosinicella sp.]